MIREGYIERSIRQLRQAFAALLGKVDRTVEPAILEARLDELYREHLGISRQILETLDTASRLHLLEDRAFVAVELMRGERDLLAAAGRTSDAADVDRRLAELKALVDGQA